MVDDDEMRQGTWRLGSSTELLLDSIPAMVFVKDTKNRILFTNGNVANSLGVDQGEMADTPSERWYPEHAEAYHRHDLEIIRTRKPLLGIREPKRVANGEIMLETDKFPILEPNGEVAGVIAIAKNTSDQHAQLERLQQLARLDSVGQIVAGVAHSYGNLLPILSYHTELARSSAVSPEEKAAGLGGIAQAVKLATGLTQQLLDLAGGTQHPRAARDLAVLAEEVHDLLRPVVPERVRLQLELSNQPMVAEVRASEFSEVLINLVLNAIDAMPDGGTVTIGMTRRPGTRGQSDVAVLTVSDTGIGIDPKARAQIFEPLFTTKTGASGAGLGLTRALSIVKNHGGDIEVVSADGAGTTFTLTIPLGQ